MFMLPKPAGFKIAIPRVDIDGAPMHGDKPIAMHVIFSVAYVANRYITNCTIIFSNCHGNSACIVGYAVCHPNDEVDVVTGRRVALRDSFSYFLPEFYAHQGEVSGKQIRKYWHEIRCICRQAGAFQSEEYKRFAPPPLAA